MKKLLAVLLSLCLVVGMVPMMAFADDGAAASSDWVYGPDYPAWYVGEDGYDWSVTPMSGGCSTAAIGAATGMNTTAMSPV